MIRIDGRMLGLINDTVVACSWETRCVYMVLI